MVELARKIVPPGAYYSACVNVTVNVKILKFIFTSKFTFINEFTYMLHAFFTFFKHKNLYFYTKFYIYIVKMFTFTFAVAITQVE